VYAQDSTKQTGRYIERSINGQTYVYDTLTHQIQNKRNYIHEVVDLAYCEEARLKGIRSYNYIFDEIFSAKRKEELKGTTLPMRFYYDSSGKLLEIIFTLTDISMLTMEEVYALETAFLDHRVEIVNACPDKKYYLLMAIYRF
jgi:hypothetical protein